jgi:nucleoside-diphosphate-sugar epimerase
MKIGIVGAGGYVGNSIYKSLIDYKAVPIYKDTKTNIDFDIVIHAANPAKRFYANNHIEEDFENTVINTKKILQKYSCKTILISSISCRTELDTPYGDHRKMCEELVLEKGGTVFRLGPLFGGTRKEDILHDIVSNKKVYYSEDTKYAYVDVEWASEYVCRSIERVPGVYEIGAFNTVTLKEIAEAVNSESIFEGKNDDQYPLNFKDGPDASEAIKFALSLI